MATMAELAEERRVRDEPMLEMVRAGRTAKQIGKVVGLAAGTVRHRVQKYGVKCVTWQEKAGVAPKEAARMSKPCKCDGICQSVHAGGHRFGPDLTCACGTHWHLYQRDPVPCEIGVPVEQLDVEQLETCRNGHDISHPDSVYTYPSGRKNCRTCRTEWELRSRRKKRERGGVVRYRPDPDRKYCSNGHPWTDVYRNPNGKEQCRVCRREQHRKYANRRKEGK